MLKTMPALAALLFLQGGSTAPLPATDVPSSVIQQTLREAIASHTTDTPIRTVNAGGHNVGIGVVQRPKGSNLRGGAVHNKVTEVYQVLEGSATLVTGGRLVNPQVRDNAASVVTQINGPGVSGTAIEGGVSRHIGKGDMVIIPAGTPHWFPEIQEDITYTVVRVDPERVVTLK
jgi:mannose-6-phosphate isomerase-like protein (cupin superfamily)